METDITKTTTTQLKTGVTDYKVAAKVIDEATTQDETYWENPYWTIYLGYLKTIPEYARAVRSLSIWAFGKGWIADNHTTNLLNLISGWGNESFDEILQDLLVIKKTNGDAYAEIITDNKKTIREGGIFINLKKLNPSNVRHVINPKGLIIRYDIKNTDGKWHAIDKENIFHISNDRIANEIHGTSVIESCKFVIDWKNEIMSDLRRLMHRSSIRVIYIDVDKTSELNTFREQYKAAIKNGEVLILPGRKGQDFEVEQIELPDTNRWMIALNYLDNYFYEVLGVSKIITGGVSGTTEANAKMGYLSFEQPYMTEQRLMEQDLWSQLGIKITFNRPVSISSTMQESEMANTGQTSFQPSDLINKENE